MAGCRLFSFAFGGSQGNSGLQVVKKYWHIVLKYCWKLTGFLLLNFVTSVKNKVMNLIIKSVEPLICLLKLQYFLYLC